MIWLSTAWSALTSPTGRFALLLLAFVGWTVYQRHDAKQAAEATCQADALREELSAVRRLLKSSQEISENSKSRADALAARLAEDEAAGNEALTGTTGSCTLDDDFRGRLRDLRQR